MIRKRLMKPRISTVTNHGIGSITSTFPPVGDEWQRHLSDSPDTYTTGDGFEAEPVDLVADLRSRLKMLQR